MKKNNVKTLFKVMLLLFTLCCSRSVPAENYPYRSDYLWLTMPDHADWLYCTGEKVEKYTTDEFDCYLLKLKVDSRHSIYGYLSYIVWNLITAPKESLVTPINEHWTSEITNYRQILWLKAHIK